MAAGPNADVAGDAPDDSHLLGPPETDESGGESLADGWVADAGADPWIGSRVDLTTRDGDRYRGRVTAVRHGDATEWQLATGDGDVTVVVKELQAFSEIVPDCDLCVAAGGQCLLHGGEP